jgi:hypothetical protein
MHIVNICVRSGAALVNAVQLLVRLFDELLADAVVCAQLIRFNIGRSSWALAKAFYLVLVCDGERSSATRRAFHIF